MIYWRRRLDAVGEFPKQRTYAFHSTEYKEFTHLRLNSPTVSSGFDTLQDVSGKEMMLPSPPPLRMRRASSPQHAQAFPTPFIRRGFATIKPRL
jgi:hypothetical protein